MPRVCPRDFVSRHFPREAAGCAEALTLGEKCLAAPQILLRALIFGRFSLLAGGDVLQSHENTSLGMGRHRQRTGVENQGPLALSRDHVIHFNGLERMTAGKHVFELPTQRSKCKGAVPDLIHWNSLCLLARDTERVVECAIARLNAEVSAQYDERLCEFAFVNGLIDRVD